MRAEELIATLRGRQSKLDAPLLLDKCDELGICLWPEGEGLRVKGPLTDELRDDLKRCKADIIRLLATVPAWNAAEANDLAERIKTAHAVVWGQLHPAVDDPFSIAGRNVCADMLAAIERSIAARRIDTLRRRVDFTLGWFATLDKTLHELRTPGAWGKYRPF